jgi:hypothetical protein
VRAVEPAITLLERTGIASVPEMSFFKDPVGETVCRFCFPKEDTAIEERSKRRPASSARSDHGGRDGAVTEAPLQGREAPDSLEIRMRAP